MPDLPDTPDGQAAPRRILLVEDETLIALALADFLHGCGHHVIMASNGNAALTMLEHDRVDALISDIHLGSGIDGLELAAWVRSHLPGVRVMLASGVWEHASEAKRVSDAPLLRKPYVYAEVRAALGP